MGFSLESRKFIAILHPQPEELKSKQQNNACNNGYESDGIWAALHIVKVRSIRFTGSLLTLINIAYRSINHWRSWADVNSNDRI